MDALYKKISGDWFDIKEKLSKYYDLFDYFKSINLLLHIEKLKFSVEQGITEYKKTVISPFFRTMENVKFKTPGIDDIKNQTGFLNGILFTILTQRLITAGEINISKQKNKKNHTSIHADLLDLKEIFSDLNDKIINNPELSKNHYYKNILMQVPIMKKEQETMKKLLPTIKPESKESFLNNFKNVFIEIENKIKNNYKAILDNENPKSDMNKNILEIIPLKHLSRILLKQAEIISKLRSILIFAVEDKYKIREILLSTVTEKQNLNKLISSEDKEYRELLNSIPQNIKEHQNIGDDPHFISRSFCKEIIGIFERNIK